MGRIKTEQRTIAGVTNSMGYAYNLESSMNSLTYPSGRVVNYTADSAGRPLTATDANGFPYTTNATYWPNGRQWSESSRKTALTKTTATKVVHMEQTGPVGTIRIFISAKPNILPNVK